MKYYTTLPWTVNGVTKNYRTQQIDAKGGSDWNYVLEEIDNTDGKRGHENDCVMANGANRQRAKCSYKTIGWIASKTRMWGVIAIDEKTGGPSKVVRYFHNYGDQQKAFDRSETQFKPGTVITLHAPHGRDRLGRRPKLKKRYKATGTHPRKRPSKLMRISFTPRARSVIQWADELAEKHHRSKSQEIQRLIKDAHA